MGTPHKHRDVIIAWANGEEIQCKDDDTGRWFTPTIISWSEDKEYRIKPKRVKKEGWVNVYSQRTAFLYETKVVADSVADPDRKACIHIEWEEEE